MHAGTHTISRLRTIVAVMALGAVSLGSGCSLLSDFGDYKFGKKDSEEIDAGVDDSGYDGGGGEEVGGSGGTGEGGAGGTGKGGAGGTQGGAGTEGSAGSAGGGVDGGVGSQCDDTHPCNAPLRCVNGACALPPQRVGQAFFQTNAGGVVGSTDYRLSISIGVPQPVGAVSSQDFKIVMGPGVGGP